MCSIDYCDERCDIWNVSRPRARKEVACQVCHRTIPRGEKYRRVDSLFMGDWSVERLCQHCAVAADWLTEECGGYLQKGVGEEIREHAEEYRIASLWKLIAGADRKWVRFDGNGLMPIPKMPPLSRPQAATSP